MTRFAAFGKASGYTEERITYSVVTQSDDVRAFLRAPSAARLALGCSIGVAKRLRSPEGRANYNRFERRSTARGPMRDRDRVDRKRDPAAESSTGTAGESTGRYAIEHTAQSDVDVVGDIQQRRVRNDRKQRAGIYRRDDGRAGDFLHYDVAGQQ